MKILSVILLAMLFLTSCDNSGSKNSSKYISATACAKSLSNGEVVDCTPTESMQNKHTSFLHLKMKIDEENPGPKGPDILHLENTQLFSVKEVRNNGTLLLENGIKLKLAGLECRNEETVKYLRAVFLNADASKLAYSLTGYADGQYKYAYVWQIGSLDEPDFGPTLSSSNETVITSGWCKPIKQEKHLYHSRYKRFEEIANEL
ncbi:MAG: hypothetical protein KUF72_17270 [Candidatus Thiodiazotropha sp. (ex Ctena orbiculata)]|nr:hypothetical protein [Candidatus Thiodiazotropha taylori]